MLTSRAKFEQPEEALGVDAKLGFGFPASMTLTRHILFQDDLPGNFFKSSELLQKFGQGFGAFGAEANFGGEISNSAFLTTENSSASAVSGNFSNSSD